MPRYLVLTKHSTVGCRAVSGGADLHAELNEAVAAAGGRVVEQYAVIGDYDVCSLVEVRDNDTAQQVDLQGLIGEGDRHLVMPAIEVSLFTRLLGQSTVTTGPYRWQISWPARVVRRVMRRHAYSGVAATYFEPFTVIGGEHLDRLRGPAVFIANHTSFMDTPAMHEALPRRYRAKVAWPAAADRFFIKGRKELRKQGWWFSLVYNSFPLRRGGGRAALAHADWLLEKGWSIGIFPEGARTSATKLARFRMGPAILAIDHGVPVVPMYLDGLAAIRPKGSRQMQPGPVTVRVGPPIRFAPGADVGEATRVLYRAVSELGRQAAEDRRARRAAAARTGGGDADDGRNGEGNGHTGSDRRITVDLLRQRLPMGARLHSGARRS